MRTMMALNAETKNDDGSKHQSWEEMMVRNVKIENDDGFER